MTTLASREIVEQRPVAMRRVFRFVKRGFLFLIAGLLFSVLMAWALGMWGEPSGGTTMTAAAPERGRIWEVYTWSSSGSMRIYSKRQAQSWSGYQVTGPPDA